MRPPGKISLAVSLVGLVVVVIVLAILSAGFLIFSLNWLGIIDIFNESNRYMPLFVMIYIFIFQSVVIAALLSRRSVRPIRDMMKATDEVAKGDFSVVVKGSSVFELDSLAASFNKMVQELKGIETLRSDFVRNVSHEFKTPIASISGFAKLLREDDLSENERKEYLESIIQESERLVELSTNILHLSKVDNMNMISEKITYRLDEQIRLAILMMEPKWSAKNLHLDARLEDEIDLFGNKNLIHQVWINLLDNAIKFTDSGGTLEIGLWQSEGQAIFRLRDTGCGMSEQTMRHMFDKFYQGDVSHAMAGNGLGLALVNKIVELSEGAIEVQSELGKGSVFTVKLPLGTEG